MIMYKNYYFDQLNFHKLSQFDFYSTKIFFNYYFHNSMPILDLIKNFPEFSALY